MTHVWKLDLENPASGTFLVLTRVKTQATLESRIAVHQNVCWCLCMHVCVTVNLPPFKCVAFPLETRNCTASKRWMHIELIDVWRGRLLTLTFLD